VSRTGPLLGQEIVTISRLLSGDKGTFANRTNEELKAKLAAAIRRFVVIELTITSAAKAGVRAASSETRGGRSAPRGCGLVVFVAHRVS
jgi:hypothetical protein